MKKPMKQTIGDFLAGRGFYIVLFLCVAAIGVSGWYLMREIALPGGAPVGGGRWMPQWRWRGRGGGGARSWNLPGPISSLANTM